MYYAGGITRPDTNSEFHLVDARIVRRKPKNLDFANAAGFVWEFMFTRSMYQTDDMAEQGKLLNELSQLIEDGVITSTCNDVIKPIDAQNLRDVHQRLERGKTIGKIVLAEWR